MPAFVAALKDLRRRKVFRGAGLYLLGAWSVVQVADVLADPFGLPDWTVDALLIAALAAAPLALWLAWRYEFTERGLVRTRPAEESGADAGTLSLGPLDYLMIAALTLVAGFAGWGGVDARREAAEATVAAAAAARAEQASVPVAAANTIAVLPFDYLSADDADAFLADGVSDTVLHVLSRIPGLRVTARTSSFSFRDRALTAAEIAAALGVAHVLEGSVQRAGERIRVIARVVDARTQQEVWSGRFDRAVESIFEIQDEIAQNVAAAMRSTLQDESIAAASTYEPPLAAYEQYIRGRRALEVRTAERIERAVAHMERAVEIDAEYALAWIGLHDALRAGAMMRPGSAAAVRPRLAEIVDRALELDPLLAEAWLARSLQFADAKRFADATEALERARELNPNLPGVHHARWNQFFVTGQREAALDAIRRAVAIDPETPRYRESLALTLWALARTEAAFEALRVVMREHPERPDNYALYGRWLTQLGRAGEGMRYVQTALAIDPDNPRRLKIVCEQFTHFHDLDAARACLDDYLVVNPADLDARKWRAGILADPGVDRGDAARAAVEIGLREIEANPDFWYPRAQTAGYLLQLGEYQQVIDLLGESFPGLLGPMPRITDFSQWPARLLGEALWKIGRQDEAAPLLDGVLDWIRTSRKLQGGGWIAGVEDAMILCIRGADEACIERLGAAVDAGWLFYSLVVKDASAFDPVRDDPDYQAVVDRLKANAAEARAHYYEHRDLPVPERPTQVAGTPWRADAGP